MNIRFRKKRYTLLIIPEQGRSMLRFRLPLSLVAAVVALAVLLIAALCAMYEMHLRNLELLEALENQLTMKESEMELTILHKNERIQQLQNDILSLSEQANQIRSKVQELQQLERELRELTGTGNDGENRQQVEIASFAATLPSGGTLSLVPDDQFHYFVTYTESRMTDLDQSMASLQSSLAEAKEELVKRQEILRVTPNIWPTDSRKISSEYGYRRDPFTRRLSMHTGLDIAGNHGSPVYATADGKVITAGYDSGEGNHIVIDHTRGVRTVYMHLSKFAVKEGDTVKKGDVIGYIGSTGRSTGPHIHYEVLVWGRRVNPADYLPDW